MSWRREFSKIQGLFRRYKPADDVEEEVRFHLKMEEQENLESGMSQEEAHYAAVRRFGAAALHLSGADKARVNVVLEFRHDDEVCDGHMLAFRFKGIE